MESEKKVKEFTLKDTKKFAIIESDDGDVLINFSMEIL